MNTIAYNVIVGAGEAEILERNLSSVQCIGFDEIVVCLTSDDKKVESVANKYATKVARFDWCDDFAAARNACIEASGSDFIFFLDTDDVLTPPNTKAALDVVYHARTNSDRDFYICNYNVSFDSKGYPVESIQRIFMFRKSVTRWRGAIHEVLDNQKDKKYIVAKGLNIAHCPIKTSKESGERNLRILRKSFSEMKEYDSRLMFYYGKELFISGEYEEAREILTLLVHHKDGNCEELAHACIMLAILYGYEDYRSMSSVKLKYINEATNYANIGKGFSDKYAEFDCILGDFAYYKGQKDIAVERYLEALGKTYGNALLSQDRKFYGQIPASKLSAIMYQNGNVEDSLKFNRIAIESGLNCREARKLIINTLIEDEICA